MSEHVKIIFGSEETNMHHDLDIHPIPEKVLYINDLTIANTASIMKPENNIRKPLPERPVPMAEFFRMIMSEFMCLWI